MIPLNWYLTLSTILFGLGVMGVLMRRNVLVVMMAVELIMNAVNLNLIAFSRYFSSIDGQIFVIFTITITAAESALGLALIIAISRSEGTLYLDEMHLMKW